MKFKTKRDPFFIKLGIAFLLLINILILLPPLIIDPSNLTDLLKAGLVALLLTGFMIWLAIDISYELKKDYLLVKGGIFRSKIDYKEITKITGKPNIWVGYRILFSKDAIEIHYKTAIMGSVIISPDRKEEFIEALLRQNNDIPVHL